MSRQKISDNFVRMEKNSCPVCGVEHDVGVMIHKHLREIPEKYTLTGFSLCPEHKALFEEGYLALVAIDESKSDKRPNGNFNPEDVWRTGIFAHLKRHVVKEFFNTDIPEDMEFIYVEPEVIEILMERTNVESS